MKIVILLSNTARDRCAPPSSARTTKKLGYAQYASYSSFYAFLVENTRFSFASISDGSRDCSSKSGVMEV